MKKVILFFEKFSMLELIDHKNFDLFTKVAFRLLLSVAFTMGGTALVALLCNLVSRGLDFFGILKWMFLENHIREIKLIIHDSFISSPIVWILVWVVLLVMDIFPLLRILLKRNK